MNEKIKGARRASLIYAYAFSAILLVGYIIVYQFAPFEEPWNDITLNALTVISAFFGAAIASLIFFHYEKDDAPRIVWGNMMIGCWLWFVAEVAWSLAVVHGMPATKSASGRYSG